MKKLLPIAYSGKIIMRRRMQQLIHVKTPCLTSASVWRFFERPPQQIHTREVICRRRYSRRKLRPRDVRIDRRRIVAAETSEQAAKVVPEADRRARSVSVARTGLIEIDFGSRGRVRVDEVPSPNAERFAIRRKAVRRVSDPARFRSSEG